MASSAPAGEISPAAGKQPVTLKLAHGVGAAAFGIKNNGFDYFLLFFYGNVIGLEQWLVGLALFIALVVDAISDPLVGYWSDNLRSRWGRRHPFMYAAALPVSLSYFLLWVPPDLGQTGLFIYLTSMAVMIRTFITFYETPSTSLLPELTRDYDERASMQSYRLLFGWAGGNVMSVLMWGVLLAGVGGRLQPEGYATYGVIAGVLMFLAITISALGTHHRIPTLSRPSPSQERYSVRRIFREMAETLSEKSFLALFFAMVFGSISTGIAAALSFTLLTYFWEFSSEQIFVWVAAVFFSAILGFLIAPWSARRFGKKKAVIGLGLLAFTIAPAPVLLRVFGLMPENGDPILFPLLVSVNVFDIALIIALQAVIYSMIADLVEANELKTGRRSEGVYYAAITFTRKTTQGLGVLAAGAMMSAIAFPEKAQPGSVPEDTLWWLGVLYAPALYIVWAAMLFSVSRYKIDKAQHEENLRRLADRS